MDQGALLGDLRALIHEARQRVASAANSALTMTYWRLGKRLLADDLADGRGEYGRRILATLSHKLVAEFGAGFTHSASARPSGPRHLSKRKRAVLPRVPGGGA